MKNIISIAKREFRSYFVSPIGYFVVVLFSLVAGYFFFIILAQYLRFVQQYSMMQYGGDRPTLNSVVSAMFQSLVVVLAFLIPLLTMRTVAEEKKSGTFELLVTSPLSVLEIVVGKFFGVSAVFFLMVLAAATFPLLLILFGEPGPEIGPILSGLLGFILCGLAFISIGIVMSCINDNQIVAGVSALVVLLLLYLIQAAAGLVGGGIAEEVLLYISPAEHMADFLKGVISLKSVIYFLSLISLGIFSSQCALQAYRWR